jgi:hypothetical protein
MPKVWEKRQNGKYDSSASDGYTTFSSRAHDVTLTEIYIVVFWVLTVYCGSYQYFGGTCCPYYFPKEGAI